MKAQDKFREILKNHHEYAKDWKERTKGKVIASFSGYDPEELIYAAGALPVHVMGGYEPDSIVAPHVYTWNCGPSRDILAQALRGRYDYVDGILMTHDCFHLRQTFDSWERHTGVSFSHQIYCPRNVKNRAALRTYKRALDEYKNTIEKTMGATITDEQLAEAIAVYNENRSLMKEVYELRKGDNPPITGTEALEMVLTSMVMDKKEHTVLMKQFLQELHEKGPGEKPALRLMVVGSCVDNPRVISTLESFGSTVVIDELCTGSRYFWNNIKPNPDLIQAIAERYINKLPHPERDLVDRSRPEFIANLAVEYRAQAAIILLHKYCDRLEWELPHLQAAFREKNVPSIVLEDDITIPEGQWKMRAEALFEIVNPQ